MTLSVSFMRVLVVRPKSSPHPPREWKTFRQRHAPIPDEVPCPNCSGPGFGKRYSADYFETYHQPRSVLECSYCAMEFIFSATGQIILRG